MNDPRPLAPLDRLIDQGLRLFEAALPRALLLAVGGGVAFDLLARQVLGPDRAVLDDLIERGQLGALLERFGPTLAALALPMVWLNAAVLRLVGGVARDEPIDAGAALGLALRALPHLLLATLFAIVLLWFGLLALLLPGVWLAVSLSFYQQAILFDGHDGVRALGASFRAVRGRWWRTFAFYLVLGVGLLLGVALASLAARLTGAVLGVALEPALVATLVSAVGAALGAVLGLALDAMLVVYYSDLTARPSRAPPPDTLLV